MNTIMIDRRMRSLRNAMEPIISFLDDDSVIEIMLNPDGKIWIDQIEKGMSFTGVVMAIEDAERMLRLISAQMGREINDKNPSLAAKLPYWNARVQATIPPVVESPCFAIRKPPKVIFSLDDYVKSEILKTQQADFLTKSVLEKKNILVGGGTGSGKTTLLNALLKVVAGTNDRVFIVEDNAELQCAAENKLQLLTIPGQYDHRRALMDALRYNPDRIIFGEVRDGAALDLLKAWNTGHPGGLATIHADNAFLMLDRMCQMIEEVVPVASRYMVAEAVDICVHIKKNNDCVAGRQLSGIVSVEGIDKSGSWVINKIY